jgi:hypothetical protein
MKIGGMGYAVLRVTAEQVRELHQIPSDVIFERTISSKPSAFVNDLAQEWCLDQHPFYFRIRHRYLPRCVDRGPLVCFTLSELLNQYQACQKSEEESKGKPLPPDYPGPWVEDDA